MSDGKVVRRGGGDTGISFFVDVNGSRKKNC